jgi:hypothetical protein
LYLRPSTLSEAVSAVATSEGQILAGRTDFFPALGDRAVTTRVVNISALRELKGIVLEPDFICIGGLTTWAEIVKARLSRPAALPTRQANSSPESRDPVSLTLLRSAKPAVPLSRCRSHQPRQAEAQWYLAI